MTNDKHFLSFIETIANWHTAKVNNLRQLAQVVGAGTKIKRSPQDTSPVTLNQRDVEMFKLGLQAAMDEIYQLPFSYQKNETEIELKIADHKDKFTEKQLAWCTNYEESTGYPPMMNAFIEGRDTFDNCAAAAVKWFRDMIESNLAKVPALPEA